ncbi:AAA family ATPase [Nocardioides bruguierae]|uniref:AAA family ATPase n=1 Tax=Nocardioides bruguierae TaxID=2945102 RepID=UPI002021B2A7|nr:AAA family ATPase [Nocardioides bruguierae]MCL8024518.1 AAA family ATPase [Nocardioides bruguierae]
MPLLGPLDPLPRPHRVLVAGTSGSGKTTLARRVSALTDIGHTELDALHHGPQWTPRPEFLDDVRALVAGPTWITELQYGTARPLLLERADTLVWLDLPRRTVMRQLVARTLRRRLRREVLWNGNVEPPLHTFLTDRDHVVRWGWRGHGRTAARVDDARVAHPGLVVVRLRSHREADAWLAGPLTDATRGG